MRGEFIAVWTETPREIWDQLVIEEGVPHDVFCELYRCLAPSLRARSTAQELADIVDDPIQSRDAFFSVKADDLIGEGDLVLFLEKAYDTFYDFGGDPLANRYFNLIEAFIIKFSLRYDLRRPCILCPTLPGMFTSLVRELRAITNLDPQLDQLMKDYEDSIRDLRFGCTDGRIKTCVGKQFMLLEGIGAVDPGVTKNTLGDMCDQLKSWPHATIKEALKKLYGFASDYPGIRHGSRGKGALRSIEMRDMVAMSILLMGFTPYLDSRLRSQAIFGGSALPVASPPTAVLPSSGSANSSHNTRRTRSFLGWLVFWRR